MYSISESMNHHWHFISCFVKKYTIFWSMEGLPVLFFLLKENSMLVDLLVRPWRGVELGSPHKSFFKPKQTVCLNVNKYHSFLFFFKCLQKDSFSQYVIPKTQGKRVSSFFQLVYNGDMNTDRNCAKHQSVVIFFADFVCKMRLLRSKCGWSLFYSHCN